MKRLYILFLTILLVAVDAQAVLKEKDLDQTLSVLRQELTERHKELSTQAGERRKRNRDILNELKETMKRSNQNALMLYSQKSDYVFDLTYACHEATEQYQQFQRQQVPFREVLEQYDVEMAKYDSLVNSLRKMPMGMLSNRAKTDRSVCLTLATNIRNTLKASSNQMSEYMRYYEMSEQRLKQMNDYANLRYNEIQTGIFMNGGDNFFKVLKNLPEKLDETREVVIKKYRPTENSQWDSRIIFGLFVLIAFYILVATLLNMLVIRFLLSKKLRSKAFLQKRSYIIMATTTITFAILLAIARSVWPQNFLIMASDLLIEYAWLLGVILVSLLLRVESKQIKSAFHIYSPLVFVGFLVIAFRIILIPRELVNMIFPPILLLCTLWQWVYMSRHNKNVPQQDMIYTYISQAVFVCSLVCSWMGYTLLSVQILIWWIMQLTCILTITCISRWLKLRSIRKHYENRPISHTWLFLLIHKVAMPIMGVLSVMISIYWAADVFNLSDLCWELFNRNIINLENLQVSIVKLSMVICLWFLFSYSANTILSFLRMHYENEDPSTAASRSVMSRNIIQVFVWGVWLLMSLSLLHVSLAWLLAISGGLSTGIGFASKNIIENIFYGASLMAGRLKVGDMIEVDGTMGKVQSISYTSTIVESLFGEVITFQNSQLFDKNYKNLTKNHGYVLVVVPFGVAYGSNVARVQKLVEEAVNNLNIEYTDPDKQVKTVMTGMGDSSVDFKMFVWSDATKRSFVISEVLRCIYDTLNANGIEIPFPQRDITIKNADAILKKN